MFFSQYVQDGTEDISCKMDKTNWTVEDNVTGKFSASEAEKYWESLRIHFISYLVFPGIFCQQAFFSIKISQVPPILHPSLAGQELFNTEHLKNSYVLKNIHQIQGTQSHSMKRPHFFYLVLSYQSLTRFNINTFVDLFF